VDGVDQLQVARKLMFKRRHVRKAVDHASVAGYEGGWKFDESEGAAIEILPIESKRFDGIKKFPDGSYGHYVL
jgi:hypothetical protein